MTQTQINDLLGKVALLEAKATILLEETAGIRKMLQDIVDPENKKAQAAFERARKKAEKKAQFQASVQRMLERRNQSIGKKRQAAEHGKKPGN